MFSIFPLNFKLLKRIYLPHLFPQTLTLQPCNSAAFLLSKKQASKQTNTTQFSQKHQHLSPLLSKYNRLDSVGVFLSVRSCVMRATFLQFSHSQVFLTRHHHDPLSVNAATFYLFLTQASTLLFCILNMD